MEGRKLLTVADCGVPSFNTDGTEKVFALRITLARLIEKRGISQTNVSIETGIPHSTLGDWLHGVAPRGDSLPAILRLANYFNVSFYYLCFGEPSDQEVMREKIKELQFKLEKKEWELQQLDMFVQELRSNRPA